MKRRSWQALGFAVLVLVAGRTAGQGSIPQIRYAERLRMPSAQDQLGNPRAVHADLHTGEIFVCDTRQNRIVIFDRQGLYLYQIPGGEIFRAPVDVAVDPEGYILVLGRRGIERFFSPADRVASGRARSASSRRRLLLLDFDGKFLREVPLSGLPEGSLEPSPISVALAPAGDRLYVVDQANQHLWLADRDGKIRGAIDLAADLTATKLREQLVGHVDVYGDTVLVAVPTAGQILLFDLDGGSRGHVGFKGASPCQLMFAVAAARAADGRILVLDQRRMILMLWDPRTNRCLAEYSGFGNAPGALYLPADLALDGEGRVWISQGFEGRVQLFAGADPAMGAPE